FDPLDKVRILMDRYRQYKLVDDSALSSEIGLFTPTFVELNSKNVEENVEKLKAAGVKYPFVCKPTVAHGSTLAHHMSLIFCEDGLNDITPPCVAQTFINHNARLFKLFVIKNDYYIIERPSLKNFIAGNFPTIHFCSHDISKPKSCSSLSELDESDLQSISTTEPDKSRLDKIVEVITDKLGLSLYGIDVIIENGTGRYAIIDMNAFPGYEGVDNILELLRDMIVEEINKQNAIGQKCMKECNCEIKAKCEADAATVSSQGNEKVKDEAKKSEIHNDIDSGIETSDSCDEQKNKAICVKSMRRQHSKNCANSST
ncbi:inositol-tetrakisphosphate 1-kinase-like protein, partial [Leptotrombidium deliense]